MLNSLGHMVVTGERGYLGVGAGAEEEDEVGYMTRPGHGFVTAILMRGGGGSKCHVSPVNLNPNSRDKSNYQI